MLNFSKFLIYFLILFILSVRANLTLNNLISDNLINNYFKDISDNIQNENCTRDITIYQEALINNEFWALKSEFLFLFT